MAKMFYELKEAAEKLAVSEDEVKQLAEQGKLQQFRDGSKLMFKREQVDALQVSRSSDPVMEDSDVEISLADEIDTEATKTDTIDLMEETGEEEGAETGAQTGEGTGEKSGEKKKSDTATGISVFDADEVEQADPMAQTQVSDSFIGDEEELSLDSVGSGSGLLDLTRESDDTSLGAVELLEDVGADTGIGSGSGKIPASSTGIFEGAGADSAPSAVAAEPEPEVVQYVAAEEADPAGDGFVGGMLLGVFITLVVATIIVAAGTRGLIVPLTNLIAEHWLYAVLGLAGISIVFGLLGWMIGKSRAGSAKPMA